MIGVVGGGVAGLAAAHRLTRTGYDVTVYEAEEVLGGLAVSYETSGDPIERFYHHLSKSEETIVSLARQLGIGDAIEWRIGRNSYYVDGDIHPLDTPWEIGTFPPLSLYDKFRLGMLTLGIDLRGGRPSQSTYDSLEDFEDVPVKQFVEEHTTPRVYENFFEPLLEAKFGSRAEDVSAAWLLGRVQFRGERDIFRGEILGYLDGGFHRLITALVDSVGRENIQTGVSVTDIRVSGDAVDSIRLDRGSATELVDVDALVVATMPNVLETLTGYQCAIDFQGTVCALVTLNSSLTDTYWLNIADESRFGVLIEHTNFVPPSRYGGDHLVYLASYIQDFDAHLWQLDDDEVATYWLAGLEDLFPSFEPSQATEIRIARNPRTAPIYERGYLEHVIPFDLSAEVAEGLFYAGMASRAQYPERSLNGGIESGFECAERVGQFVARTKRTADTPTS